MSHRVSDFPDIPSLAEADVLGIDVSGWYNFSVPAKTPPAIIETLNHATREVLVSSEGRLRGLCWL
jgi:tripartite-type tricarboxylate transporter receptor subunit TctC